MHGLLLGFCFAFCGLSFVAAQTNPDPIPSPSAGSKTDRPVESLPPIFAPRPPVKDAKSGGASQSPPTPSSSAPAQSRRALSPEMAAKLSAAIVARAAASASVTPSADGTATAPPGTSADAVQLKPYVVREDRVIDFKERDILTAKGMAALARSRYPGVGFLTDAAAAMWMADQLAKERLQEMRDLGGLIEIGGGKPPPELNRTINDAKQVRREGPFPAQFGRPSGPQ